MLKTSVSVATNTVTCTNVILLHTAHKIKTKNKTVTKDHVLLSVMQNEEINCQIFVKFRTGVCLQKVVK